MNDAWRIRVRGASSSRRLRTPITPSRFVRTRLNVAVARDSTMRCIQARTDALRRRTAFSLAARAGRWRPPATARRAGTFFARRRSSPATPSTAECFCRDRWSAVASWPSASHLLGLEALVADPPVPRLHLDEVTVLVPERSLAPPAVVDVGLFSAPSHERHTSDPVPLPVGLPLMWTSCCPRMVHREPF